MRLRFRIFLGILPLCSFLQGCIVLPVPYQKFSTINGTIKKNGLPIENVEIWYAQKRDCLQKGSSVAKSREGGEFLLQGVREFPSSIPLLGIADCRPTLCIQTPSGDIKTTHGILWGCNSAPEQVVAECDIDKIDKLCSVSLPPNEPENK